jgi:DNA (cytosine-5)-methyltransferase 1
VVKPRFLIIENVTGMTSAEDGWFWQRQKRVYREAGYKLFGPFQLNAVDYGVAQTRKRVFVVGVRRNVDYEYTCPRATHGQGTPREHKTLRDVISGMPRWPTGEYCEASFHGHSLTRNRKRGWDDPSYTIVANDHHVPLHPMGRGMRFVKEDTWVLQGSSNRRLSWRECARIQGFPKSFEPDLPLTSLYRIVGNAVPWRFGEALLRPLVSAFT